MCSGFGIDPDADPDPRIRTFDNRTQEAQNHTDPTNPDPEHC
jgi:hypothetical protein